MSTVRGPVVAVVGHGPRALWALESLDRLLSAGDHATDPVVPTRVDCIGTDVLGPGRVYAEDQPAYLRLNVASSAIRAWPDGRGPSLDVWRERLEPGSTVDQHPPRALAGRYLREQAERVVASLDVALAEGVVVVDAVVGRITVGPGGTWFVDDRGPYDEVLLAVGHAPTWSGSLGPAPGEAPVVPALPVSRVVGHPALRRGALVAVRGAALTALDVVLSLTLGRGQEPEDTDLRIVVTSRTGRLMLPRTDPHVVAERVDDELLARRRDEVEAGHAVRRTQERLAADLLGGTAADLARVGDASRELMAWPPPRPDAVTALRRGIAEAEGRSEPSAAWALGQAWRLLYASIVRRAADTVGGGPTLDWPDYARWSVEMERLAFGPPVVSARLLLRAVEAGVVSFTTDDVRTLGADLVVDAVLAPPGGCDRGPDDVVARAVADGLLSTAAGRRGVRVGSDGTALDSDGRRVAGLAVVGRATEDVVVGTDTLVRSLHTDIERWAGRVLATRQGALA